MQKHVPPLQQNVQKHSTTLDTESITINIYTQPNPLRSQATRANKILSITPPHPSHVAAAVDWDQPSLLSD